MSIVKETIVAEIQKNMQISVNYAKQIEQAKTKTKKKLLSKKLKKNNEIVYELLQMLESVTESKNDE